MDWYYGEITRAEAEKLLDQQSKGCFVVRISERSPKHFSVSIKSDDGVCHFKVQRDLQAKFFLWEIKFDSLNELIDYYRESPVFRSKNIRLRDISVTQNKFNQMPKLVIGRYDFTPKEEGELAFKKGDVITVINSCDVNWWRGEIGCREGIFPVTYVSPYLVP